MIQTTSSQDLESRIHELEAENRRLREENNRFVRFADLSVDMLCIAGLDGRFYRINAAWEEALGHPLETLVKTPFMAFVHSDDREATRQAFERLKAGQFLNHFQNRYRCADGSYKWLSWTAPPFNGEDNTYAVARDMTEQKNLEISLRTAHHDLETRVAERTGELTAANERLKQEVAEREKSEQAVRAIFESVQAGILIIDAEDHVILDANPAALSLIGRSKEEIVGHECHRFVCPAEQGACPATDLDQSIDNSERILLSRTGEEIPILKTITPIVHGGRAALLESFLDLRKLKAAEIKKMDLEVQLRKVQKLEAIAVLAGGIAHDFNNILFPIMGYTEMLLNDASADGKTRRYSRQIMKSIQRARDLVSQILTFSRQAEGDLKPVRPQTILKEALKLCRATIPTTIGIRQAIQSDCRPVLADPTQIHQIAMNLVTNAYHTLQTTGGELTVTLEEADLPATGPSPRRDPILLNGYARFSVADTGPGIEKAILDRIFEPYFTTKPKEKGTGLGLSIVHGIVKKLGGEIFVSSRPGKTVFDVYLPLLEKKIEEPPAETDAETPGGVERILLVDDELPIVELEKQMLERLGYRITTRLSSVDALEAFRARPDDYDLVITDMNMPNMDGVELARRLIDIRPDLPVVLCTGFSELIDEKKAGEIGIRGFLMKPLLKSEMAAAIRRALDG